MSLDCRNNGNCITCSYNFARYSNSYGIMKLFKKIEREKEYNWKDTDMATGISNSDYIHYMDRHNHLFSVCEIKKDE